MFDRCYLEAFRADILSAICVYQADKAKKQSKLSARRAKDISHLKALLGQGYFQTQDCIHDINAYLKQMRTGFWVFQTRRSRLKRLILPIIRRYANLSLRRHQATLKTLAQQIENEVMSTKVRPLQHKIFELEDAYQRLKTAYAHLRDANHGLSARLSYVCAETQLAVKTGIVAKAPTVSYAQDKRFHYV